MVEVLIAMAVGMVVLGAVYATFTLQSRHLAGQEQIAELYQNARTAMDIMVREIAMAGYNQTSASCPSPPVAVRRCSGVTTATNTPCTGITNAGTSAISFTADLNANCDTTAGGSNPNENITYDLYVSGGVPALGRTSNGSRQPAVEYVDSLSFQYFDAAGAATTNVAAVSRIRIRITTRASKTDPSYTHPVFGDRYRRYSLESFVTPRNIGLDF